MQSSSQPSYYSCLGSFLHPEFLPLCWICITVWTALVTFHLRKNSPWTLYNTPTTTFSTPFYNNPSGLRYLYSPTPHPHLPFSFHLFWIWLLSSLSWKRLQHDSSQDALGPVLVITWFLFMLFDVSAAFDRVNHLLLLKTFSSSASPALYSASLMVSSQPFLAGCFSADWFLNVGVSQGWSL